MARTGGVARMQTLAITILATTVYDNYSILKEGGDFSQL
jgi:hypothetical protein